jgi:hypothetical protein
LLTSGSKGLIWQNGRVSLIKLLATYEFQHYESRRRHAHSLSSKVHVVHAC